MAGSRLEKIGTIFSRTTGLLRTGAVKYEDRPIWFDVYRVFPPKLEPHFDREPVLPEGVPEELPNILYHEDEPRAAFYKTFGNNPGGAMRRLTSLDQNDLSQGFIDKFNEVKTKQPDWTTDQILESISDQFSFQRRPRGSVSEPQVSEPSHPKSSLSLAQLEDSELEDVDESVSTRGRRTNVIRADTLLSMFKEAQEKGETPAQDAHTDDKDKDK